MGKVKGSLYLWTININSFILDPELLLYTSFVSSRLRYILHWIFGEQINMGYRLTHNAEEWTRYDGPKINYSKEKLGKEDLHIRPHPLLQEEDVQVQELSVNRWKHSTILFYNQPGALVPFDLFAAVFYLISRYEEYLPHEKDKHGRYRHEQSVAAQFSFLQEPVIDEWLMHFKQILVGKFSIQPEEKQFRFLPTYDIDISWKYLHKGRKRQWGGYFKDILRFKWKDIAERKAVLSGKKKDPYDCFAWLDTIHKQYQVQPLYFMLLGKLSDYDKNADPQLPAMQSLMKHLAAQYAIGIHPSYGSHEDIAFLESEIKILSGTSHKTITQSRQHYIKFTLPETYDNLLAAGIKEDYSMGYASCNGFRAGTSHSFPWYNLKQEQETTLRIHPFAFMDATSKFYARQNPEETFKEWERLWYAVKKVKGTFIGIWHNYILGTHRESKDWRELYLKTLDRLSS